MLSAELGRPVTKSRETCDHGLRGVDKGCNRPAEGHLELLAWAQVGQAETNFLVSFDQEGHQNR